jgi:hypothetical protein
MLIETLDVLRCPYCGGRLSLVDSLFHTRTTDEIHEDPGAIAASSCRRRHSGAARASGIHDRTRSAASARPARRALFGLDTMNRREAFDAVASSDTATYRDTVEALGPNFEGDTLPFSDPTYRRAGGGAVGRRRRGAGGSAARGSICGGPGMSRVTLRDPSALRRSR